MRSWSCRLRAPPLTSVRWKSDGAAPWLTSWHNEDCLQEVPVPDPAPVPRLAHGLDKTVLKRGVHYLRDPYTKKFNFDPYLQKIRQPAMVDLTALPSFIRPSQDEILWGLARSTKRRYVGSTSSLTVTLCQLYFLISRYRPVNTSLLSVAFQNEARHYTPGARKPASLRLTFRNGIYAVDHVDTTETSILMELGQTMEKMLTLTQDQFAALLKRELTTPAPLDPSSDDASKAAVLGALPKREAYRYATSGDIVMRSQLDCQDDRLPRKIFDLKTRATFPVRLDVANYKNHLDYRITRTEGLFYSFEREYYDMMRSAFLKYSMQVRIGGMDGILVAYHNTDEVFGFQYIRLEEMDAALFGNSLMGGTAFGHTVQILNSLLNRVTELIPNRTLRLYIQTSKAGTATDVYVWTEDPPAAAAPGAPAAAAAAAPTGVTAEVNDEDEDDDDDEDDDMDASGRIGAGARSGHAGAAGVPPPPPPPPPSALPERMLKLRLTAESIVNGVKTEAPFVRKQGSDVWNVCFRIEDVTSNYASTAVLYEELRQLQERVAERFKRRVKIRKVLRRINTSEASADTPASAAADEADPATATPSRRPRKARKASPSPPSPSPPPAGPQTSDPSAPAGPAPTLHAGRSHDMQRLFR